MMDGVQNSLFSWQNASYLPCCIWSVTLIIMPLSGDRQQEPSSKRTPDYCWILTDDSSEPGKPSQHNMTVCNLALLYEAHGKQICLIFPSNCRWTWSRHGAIIPLRVRHRRKCTLSSRVPSEFNLTVALPLEAEDVQQSDLHLFSICFILLSSPLCSSLPGEITPP